jgi:ribosomal protein S27AE
MPYVLCPRCGIRSYSAPPWSQSPECPECGAPLDVARHGSVEARRGRQATSAAAG